MPSQLQTVINIHSGPERLVHVNTTPPAHYLVVEQGNGVFALSLKGEDALCSMNV